MLSVISAQNAKVLSLERISKLRLLREQNYRGRTQTEKNNVFRIMELCRLRLPRLPNAGQKIQRYLETPILFTFFFDL